jgi:hypothetical protein
VLQEFPRAAGLSRSFIWFAAPCALPVSPAAQGTRSQPPKHIQSVFPSRGCRSNCVDHIVFLVSEGEHHLGNWRLVLPPLLLFLLYDVQPVSYPSFKAELKTKKPDPAFS